MEKTIKLLKKLVIIVILVLIAKEFKTRASAEEFKNDRGIKTIEVYFPSSEKGPTEPKVLIPERFNFRWGATDKSGKVFCDNDYWYQVGKGHAGDDVGDRKENCKMSFVSDSNEGFYLTLYIWEK